MRDAGGYICALKWPSLYTGQDERYWRETAERQADARLIAAAPELLAAAQLALRNLHRNLASEEACGSPFMGDDDHEAIAALTAAIAKTAQP
ncbi:hypothetical protein [Pseudoxanthomonas sp. CF125]|uniref:hypothetical protein n=1 Tax=Pseudoxanthomonas sp. CF125 TaxID=1855303 RepID=UPI000B862A31|nr:hypothetical protein [Pseudoxanthomonas sp. CF125]